MLALAARLILASLLTDVSEMSATSASPLRAGTTSAGSGRCSSGGIFNHDVWVEIIDGVPTERR